jgi:hypothetical protein
MAKSLGKPKSLIRNHIARLENVYRSSHGEQSRYMMPGDADYRTTVETEMSGAFMSPGLSSGPPEDSQWVELVCLGGRLGFATFTALKTDYPAREVLRPSLC